MSVVVIQGTPESNASARSIQSRVSFAGSSVGRSLPAPQTCLFSGSFRLQPRQPIKCTPSPSARGNCRGKKRRANSISSPPPVYLEATLCAADGSTATHATCRETVLGTQVSDPTASPPSLPNFQGLSIESPGQRLQPPSPVYLATTASNHESPLSFVGSQASLGRSSFSKYHATGVSPGAASCASLKSASSPRLAAVTILTGCNSNAAGGPPPFHPLAAAASAHPVDGQYDYASPSNMNVRPPLPMSLSGSLMHLLDESASSPTLTPSGAVALKDPPPIVHCHTYTTPTLSTSWSSTNHDNNGQLPWAQPTRTDSLDTPGMRSVMSMAPNTAPLPKINLTPRSRGDSTHSRRSGTLPAFPLPDSSSFSLWKGGPSVPNSASGGSVERRAGSYIPLPDWGEPTPPARSMQSSWERQSTSLLSPPAADDALEMFLGVHNPSHDDDSLSASDDDETFFLATPSVINEERQVQQVKQRKLVRPSDASSEYHHRMSASDLTVAAALPSTTSLLGMNFVTSSNSLPGMENNSKPLEGLRSGWLGFNREESQVSIGLNLEYSNAAIPEESLRVDEVLPAEGAVPARATRDLVTPPVMMQPLSPPPLSPRNRPNDKSSTNTCRGDIVYHTANTPPWWRGGDAEYQTSMVTRTRYTCTNPVGSPRLH